MHLGASRSIASSHTIDDPAENGQIGRKHDDLSGFLYEAPMKKWLRIELRGNNGKTYNI